LKHPSPMGRLDKGSCTLSGSRLLGPGYPVHRHQHTNEVLLTTPG
jgi:hypothetical protein